MKNEMIKAVEVAKEIRKELKKHFPTIKFTVRTSNYTGGSSIIIKWVDGVTENQVKKVVNKFRGADYDLVYDVKTYLNNNILVDYILTYREITPQNIINIANLILKHLGINKVVTTIEEVESFKLNKENPKYYYLGQYARYITSLLDFTSITNIDDFVRNNL
jgi:hypothetical protein